MLPMFSALSRLKDFLSGGGGGSSGDGKDRKRKNVVPLECIDAKKARMTTTLSTIPAPVAEAGHYHRPVAGMKQNGAHAYAYSSTMGPFGSSSVRRLSDLTDISQVNNVYQGIDETRPASNVRRTEPQLIQPLHSQRPIAKRSGNAPPMLIPIKTSSSSAVSSVNSECTDYADCHPLSRHANGIVPTLRPLGTSIPEVTKEFTNLLRTKYSNTRYPVQDASVEYLMEQERERQRELKRKYDGLMKKFIPLSNDSSSSRGHLNNRSLNGDVQRSSSFRKPAVIEQIDLTDDEDEPLEDAESQVVVENTRCGRLFTTIDPAQLSAMDEERAQESRKPPPVEHVNTIRDKFQTKLRDNIIQDVQQRYGSLFSNRQSLIAKEKERLSKLSKNTEEQEGQLRNKMLNYVCSFYSFDVLDETELEEATAEPKEVPLPALTQEQLDLICRKLRSGNEVVADKFNLKIRGNDLVTLQGSNWLNDEVINFYMELLRERSELKRDQGLPKVYTFSTFFLARLLISGFSGVRRWTRKVDLLAHDMIVVPVHVDGIHWCMSIVDLRRKTIHYYDSMGSPNNNVLNALENYLREESLDKRKTALDTSGFTKANIRDCPRQKNGSDCGVFSCMFAEFLTRDHPITFSQTNMQYFRQKMMVEIVQCQLLT